MLLNFTLTNGWSGKFGDVLFYHKKSFKSTVTETENSLERFEGRPGQVEKTQQT